MSTRHFLDLDKLPAEELRRILALGTDFKQHRPPDGDPRPLAGKALAMIFEKPSTRTRVSFELGMRQMGGETIVLERDGSQLGRGETVGDTARVLSRYVDVIMLRTTDEEKLLEMAEHATVPVINGLTDRTHPCQLMADVMTFEEHLGPIAGRKIAWSGDGNNMATSWIHAAERFGFELHLACPEELRPPQDVVDWARGQGAKIVVTSDVEAAVADADCVVTDTWISMGGQVSADRHNMLRSYQVDERLMRRAKKDAIFMHCLPAHRGEEVTPSVIDGPQSAVWDEAENRLHAQKGILYWCLKQ
jgi:ornithine carbamoyltransferase